MEMPSRILIVDDEPRMRDSLKFLIEHQGYDVQTAVNGIDALDIIADCRFDLFLLDICMPEMDGFQLMEQIFEGQPDALLVMMTGQASVETALKALKKGAYDYLRKPFDDNDLVKTIQKALEHNRVKQNLKRTKIEYKYMVENSPDLIYQLDTEGRFTFVNRASERLLGCAPADLIGKHYTCIVHEADQIKSKWLFNERRTGDRATADIELRLLCKQDEGAQPPDLQKFITVELRATGMYNEQLQEKNKKLFIGTYGVARDVSYRKQLEAHLYHSQKMEAIGTLAGGIAHDFNNLLMGIQGYASLMLTDTNLANKNHGRLMNIEQHIQCGAELTRQLLGFARDGKYDMKPTDINQLINKTSNMFGRAKKEISMKLMLEKDIWRSAMDQGQIKQVLLNLYVNAWQAMPNGGQISISTSNVSLKMREVADLGIEPGNFVKISVADTGIGMDEEVRRRVFEPFFTTKERGRGTGLGLASVYGIVNNHRGTIKVSSRVDYGTTFIIFLPATSEEAEIEIVQVTPLRNGKETILVVDDETNIIDVTEELLQSLGYNVITALSGEEALDIFRKSHREIDLVILDMVMPGISGAETFGHIKDIRNDTKVLLSSGYSLKGDAKKIMAKGCNGFIQKPYNLEKLSEVLNQILDGKCIDPSKQPLEAAL